METPRPADPGFGVDCGRKGVTDTKILVEPYLVG